MADIEKYRRIARALADTQRMNAELEERVRQKQDELERHYRLVQQLSREAAVAEERQRIVTDMHDGLGGQLIAALGLAEAENASPPAIAAILRECIDDLRLTIDSLDATDDELLPALGNFRYRIEKRLRALGIELVWQVEDLPPLPYLSPGNLLHVLRILQEAFTNVLKHAQATRIVLEAGLAPGGRQVRIRVRDDGIGLRTDAAPGRGLGHLARRAAAVGGQCRVYRAEIGTVVELELPLQR